MSSNGFSISLPKNQEEMDKRSENTRMFFAKSLMQYAGVSFKDQGNFTGKIADTWAQMTEPINAQRRSIQSGVDLQYRYVMTAAVAIQPLIWFRRHRLRRMFFFWAFTSWFACPEWGRAYWRPAKSFNQLLQEQNKQDGQTTEAPKAEKKQQVAASTPTPAVVKSTTPVVQVKPAAAVTVTKITTLSVEEMRKRAADRLALEQKAQAEIDAAEAKEKARMTAQKPAPVEKQTAKPTQSNAPTPIVDAIRKRAADRVAKEQKAKTLMDAAEKTQKARMVAQKPAPVEKQATQTSSKSNAPTPQVDEMRRRAAQRIAKELNRQ